MNKEYGVKLLRLSPAISNNALNLNQVRELFSLVAAEYESLQKSGVKCYFDCPFPACLIGEKVYEKLREGLIISTHCAPKLFVTYNLKIRQCYIEPQNLPARSLRTFKDYDEVKNYSVQRLNSMLRQKFSKCENCPHSKFLWGCGCPVENSYKVEE